MMQRRDFFSAAVAMAVTAISAKVYGVSIPTDEPTFVDRNGSKQWLNEFGEFHRDGDKPALITSNGKWWYQNGKQHRDGDKPALIHVQGEWWYQHGKFHRDGEKPAIIRIPGFQTEGGKWWYQHGRLMRSETC